MIIRYGAISSDQRKTLFHVGKAFKINSLGHDRGWQLAIVTNCFDLGTYRHVKVHILKTSICPRIVWYLENSDLIDFTCPVHPLLALYLAGNETIKFSLIDSIREFFGGGMKCEN